MKPALVMGTLLTVGLATGWVAAQTAPAPAPKPRSGAETPPPGGRGMGMGMGMGGPGMRQGMGMGMMGGGGMCPMVVGGDTKIQVKNLPKGVTITLTNDNADVVTRLQKMAEGMRLMHEAHAP